MLLNDCITEYQGYIPFVINESRLTGCVTRVTGRVTLVDQELLTIFRVLHDDWCSQFIVVCVVFCWSLYVYVSFSVGHYIVCLFLLVIILSVFWFTTSVYIHVLYFLNLWYLHFYLVILALIQKSVKDSITRHEHLNIGVTFKIEYNNGKQQIYKGVSIYLT